MKVSMKINMNGKMVDIVGSVIKTTENDYLVEFSWDSVAFMGYWPIYNCQIV